MRHSLNFALNSGTSKIISEMVFEVFLFENTPAILEKTRENEVLLVIYKSEYEAGDSFRN